MDDLLIVSTETQKMTITTISIVASTIKQPDWLVKSYIKDDILDVTFVRRECGGVIQWSYQDLQINSYNLKNELEERYQKQIKK